MDTLQQERPLIECDHRILELILSYESVLVAVSTFSNLLSAQIPVCRNGTDVEQTAAALF